MEQRRERRVERVRRMLMRRGMPRLQMSLILSATGIAGFLASFVLLHAGVSRMWLRYAVAVLFAYGIFLLLLRLWVFSKSRARERRTLDIDPSGLDVPLPDLGSGSSSASADAAFSGGGDFGGGGAGGSWGASLNSAAPSSGGRTGGGSGGSGLLDGLDIGGDGDEGCLLIVALALVLAGIVASLYVVYAAPVLLAEALVEGVLLSGLYRGVKKAEQGNWLRAVVRRTWIPVLLTLIFFAAAGYVLQKSAPRARSIGEAWKMVNKD